MRGPRVSEPRIVKKGYRRFVDYPRTGRHGWRALIPSRRLVLTTFLVTTFSLVGLIAVVYAMVRTPDLSNLNLPTASVYEYSNGTPFAIVGKEHRVSVPIGQIPPTMQHAIVAIENPTFYTDSGISPRGIVRAFVNDVEGKPLQGGSTITQQFVKNAYLTDQQSITRKISEIFKAVKITRSYSKPQILDYYLNTVYFGRGSYGIDAAAEAYFGVQAKEITDPARAAYLAALVNEPSVLELSTPSAQTQLKGRWNLVLDDMVKSGYLSAAQRSKVSWPTALKYGDAVRYDADGVNVTALMNSANDSLDALHAKNPAVPDATTVEQGGFTIVTTFNHGAMVAAVKAVNAGIYHELGVTSVPSLSTGAGVHVGLATVDAATGELLAFYPGDSAFNDATQAQIEPGSQMGAFNMVAQLAIAKFPNSPQKTTAEITAEPAAESLWSLMGETGLTQNLIADPAELPEPLSKLESDPELSIGIAPETPARMASAFGVFAGDGRYRPLAVVLSVTGNGNPVWSYTPTSTQVLTPDQFKIGDQFLRARYGLTTAANALFDPAAAVSVPGTIGGDVTAWYSGYDANIVTSVAVWDEVQSGKGSKAYVTQHSLAGLGGVSADNSAHWPADVWSTYTTAVTSGTSPILKPGPGRAFGPVPSPGDISAGPANKPVAGQ
jgi:membrane peptidoglycan carboxypeptidase